MFAICALQIGVAYEELLNLVSHGAVLLKC